MRTMLGLSIAVVVLACCVCPADTLILRDGSRHSGSFVSATSRVISFKEGTIVHRYARSKVQSIEFDGAANALPGQAATSPLHSKNLASVVLPAGSEIVVLTNESIDSKTANEGQVFPADVQVIGHDNTRRRMLTNVMEQYTFLNSVQPVPARVDALKQRIDQETDPQQKTALERQVANSLAYLEQVKEVKVTPPNLTFDRTMTLYRGGREIRLEYLGRGHTDTDVVVFLPRERIVCTGDLMESVVSYMGDSFPEDWIATLERLKALDFETVMPGHGVVFKGKTKVTAFQKYLREVITQVAALRKQGLSADDAAQKVDVTSYKEEFASIRGVGVDPAAVRRIYQLAEHPAP